jgi:hypothetical protein
MQKSVATRWVIRGLKVLLAISVLLFLIFYLPRVPNDIAMYRFAHNLYDYPLLDDSTKEINRYEKIGLIVGNGNHCDFLVIRTLAASPVDAITKEKIKEYYRDVFLPAVYPEHGKVKIMISFHENVSPADGMLYYDLIIADFGYPAGLDLRGH